MDGEKVKKEGTHHVHVNPTPSAFIEAAIGGSSSFTPESTHFPVSSRVVNSLLSIAKKDLDTVHCAENLFVDFANVLLSRRSDDPVQLLMDYLSNKRLPELQSLPHHYPMSASARRRAEDDACSNSKEGEEVEPTVVDFKSFMQAESSLESSHSEGENAHSEEAGEIYVHPYSRSRHGSVVQNDSGPGKPVLSRLCAVVSSPFHREVLESVSQLIFDHRPNDVEDFLLTHWEGVAFSTDDIMLSVEGRPGHQSEGTAEQLERLIPSFSAWRIVGRHAIQLLLSFRPDNPINFLADYYSSRFVRADTLYGNGLGGSAMSMATPAAVGFEEGPAGTSFTCNDYKRSSVCSHASASRVFATRNSPSSSATEPLSYNPSFTPGLSAKDGAQQRPFNYYPIQLPHRKSVSSANPNGFQDRRPHSYYQPPYTSRIPEVFMSSSKNSPHAEGERLFPWRQQGSASWVPHSTALECSRGNGELPSIYEQSECNSTIGYFPVARGRGMSLTDRKLMNRMRTSNVPAEMPKWVSGGSKWYDDDPFLDPNVQRSGLTSRRHSRSRTPTSQSFDQGKKGCLKDQRGFYSPQPLTLPSPDRSRSYPVQQQAFQDRGVGTRVRAPREDADLDSSVNAGMERIPIPPEEREDGGFIKQDAHQKSFELLSLPCLTRRPRFADFAVTACQRDLWTFQIRNEFRLSLLANEVKTLVMEKSYREKVFQRSGSDENYFLFQNALEALEEATEHLEETEDFYLSALQYFTMWSGVL